MRWKQIGTKLLFPPIWLLIVFTIISAGMLPFVFLNGLEEAPIAYAVYVLSFYTLTVDCIFCAVILPDKYKKIKEKIYHTRYGNRYLTDVFFRTHISLYASLGVNLLYVGINVGSFALNRSMWFMILAGYYGILAVMRFLLLRYIRKNGIGKNRMGELKRAKLCAGILLTVNFVLSGAVLMILYQDKGFVYHGNLIYVMAAYTFYVTTQAIIDLVKYRKYKSPIMTITKVIAFCSALVSMLTLETAMLSEFGADMTAENKYLMVVLTGAGVSIVVIIMSIYMIIWSRKEIKILRSTQNG